MCFLAHVVIYLFPEYALVLNTTEAETNINSLESGGKFKLSNNSQKYMQENSGPLKN